MRLLGVTLVLGALGATACTPDVATTSSSSGGGQGGSGVSTGVTTSTTNATTTVGSTSGTTTASSSTDASASSSTSSTSVSTGSAMPVWGPCGGITDSFSSGMNWATLGSVSFAGGSAAIQGSASLSRTMDLPTSDCFVSFRILESHFAGDATLSLEVDGSVVAYTRENGNFATGGLMTGTSSQIAASQPTGLGMAFSGGFAWFLVKQSNQWVSIGSTNVVLGSSVVRIVSNGPGAASYDIDDFGDPIPFGALN